MPRRSDPVMDMKREKLLQALAQGHTRTTAAFLAGISIDTIKDWERRGDEYSDRIREAEVAACSIAEASIAAAMQDDWRAALAYLERRSRTEWGKQQQVELSGPAGGAIPVQFQDLSTDELRKLARGDANPNA